MKIDSIKRIYIAQRQIPIERNRRASLRIDRSIDRPACKIFSVSARTDADFYAYSVSICCASGYSSCAGQRGQTARSVVTKFLRNQNQLKNVNTSLVSLGYRHETCWRKNKVN